MDINLAIQVWRIFGRKAWEDFQCDTAPSGHLYHDVTLL